MHTSREGVSITWRNQRTNHMWPRATCFAECVSDRFSWTMWCDEVQHSQHSPSWDSAESVATTLQLQPLKPRPLGRAHMHTAHEMHVRQYCLHRNFHPQWIVPFQKPNRVSKWYYGYRISLNSLHIFRFSNLKISSNLMEGQWMPKRDIEPQNRSTSFQRQSPSHIPSHSVPKDVLKCLRYFGWTFVTDLTRIYWHYVTLSPCGSIDVKQKMLMTHQHEHCTVLTSQYDLGQSFAGIPNKLLQDLRFSRK